VSRQLGPNHESWRRNCTALRARRWFVWRLIAELQHSLFLPYKYGCWYCWRPSLWRGRKLSNGTMPISSQPVLFKYAESRTRAALSIFLPNYKKAKHNNLQKFFVRRTQLKSHNTMITDQQEILVRTNRLPSLIRHGPHRKRRVQQFCYCYLCICCCVNVSTEPLPSNDWGIFTEPFPSNDSGYTYTDWRQGFMKYAIETTDHCGRAVLRHELSSLARTLGSWIRIPLEAWMSVFILCLC
jgi:hypothetical protein